jgi:hypothetical protein
MADTVVDSNPAGGSDQRRALSGPYWYDENNGLVVGINNFEDGATWYTDDGGATWSETTIETGNCKRIRAWFDGETPGDSGSQVAITWMDVDTDDVKFVLVDASDGTHGTIRTIDSTNTVSNNNNQNRLALTKTKGGNYIVAYSTQTEIECYKSSDAFATAGTDIADVMETATQEDWIKIYPANTSDDNDAVAIFGDRSSSELSMKMWDDSAGTWTETSIVSSISFNINYCPYDAAVRHSDGKVLLAVHTDDDTTTDDLVTYTLTVDSIASPSAAAGANIFTNQAESALAAVAIDQQSDDVYVAYAKGGTWYDTVDIVFHKSTDDMVSWGSEQAYSEAAADDFRVIGSPRSIGDNGGKIQWSFYNKDTIDHYVNLVNDVEIAAATADTFISEAMIY